MKDVKSYILILLILFSVILFSSCGSQVSADNGANPSLSAAGAFARNTPDLYGEVKSISGNDVTLALLEMPRQGQFGQGQRNRNGNGDGNGNGNENGNNSQASGQNGGSTAGSSGNNDGNGNTRPRGNFSMPRNYTGQTETVTIPSDTPITSFARGNRGNAGNGGGDDNSAANNGTDNGSGNGNGNSDGDRTRSGFRSNGSTSQIQLKLSDIKIGSLMQIWYKKDSGDKKEIERVMVMDFPAAGGSNASSEAKQ